MRRVVSNWQNRKSRHETFELKCLGRFDRFQSRKDFVACSCLRRLTVAEGSKAKGYRRHRIRCHRSDQLEKLAQHPRAWPVEGGCKVKNIDSTLRTRWVLWKQLWILEAFPGGGRVAFNSPNRGHKSYWWVPESRKKFVGGREERTIEHSVVNRIICRVLL